MRLRCSFSAKSPRPSWSNARAKREADAKSVSDADLAQVERQHREFEPLDELPPERRGLLCTDRPHLDVRFGLQQHAEFLADDWVVVGQSDRDRRLL